MVFRVTSNLREKLFPSYPTRQNKETTLVMIAGNDIHKELVSLVEMTMKNSDAKIAIGGNVLHEVRQGDGLSAVLINLALDKVLKELKLNGNVLYNSKQVSAYADDITLIARNTPALQEILTLQEIGIKYGLYINEEQTIYMKMTATPSDKLPKVINWAVYF
jgi:hypothetical protein